MKKLTDPQLITEVANVLGVGLINWPRAMKALKEGRKNTGATNEQFMKAAENMASGDRRYHSLYSVFSKVEYWYDHTPTAEEETKKKEEKYGW